MCKLKKVTHNNSTRKLATMQVIPREDLKQHLGFANKLPRKTI